MTDRLSDADALIWRIEGDPVLRSPVLVVGLLDRAPAPSRLEAAVRRAVDAIPHLRHRLVPGLPGTRPRWVEDEAFALDHHLRRARAAQAAGVEAALAFAEPDATTAFDPARPMWQLTVLEGLDGGRAAFVLRFHHTITDGVGAIGLADHLFDATRQGRRAAAGSRGVAAGTATVSGRGRAAVAGQVAGGLLATVVDPLGTLTSTVRTVRSVGRMMAPARAPLSPLLVGRGLDRDLRVLELPLEVLTDAAHGVGGTVNDVFLGAVGGALRTYHGAFDTPLDAVRVTMPISIRGRDDAPGGNRFTPARFVLPVDAPDLAGRAAVAGAIAGRWRSEPAVGLTPVLAAALDRLPSALVQRAFAGMLRSIDVDAVDVPGPGERRYLGGARIDRLWAFAPPTGAAFSVTLLSYAGTACIGLSCDRAAVADADLLGGCLSSALDELAALASAGAARVAPSPAVRA